MTWVALADSGIPFTFYTTGTGEASMSGSTVTMPPSSGGFGVFTDEAKLWRLTFQSYSSAGSVGNESPSGILYYNGSQEDFIPNGDGGMVVDQFIPNPLELPLADSWGYQVGVGSETVRVDSLTMFVEVWVDGPEPPTPTEPCEEIGRATRNYVSAHQRDRVFQSSLFPNERRCLVTNFNGAIPPGRSIVRAVWQTPDTMQCAMSAPAINGREVQVTIAAQYQGKCRIRVDATLDNGEVYSAWHVIRVQPAPYFNNPGWVNGPSRLTAVAA